MSDEHFWRNYIREEKFLEEFYNSAAVAAKFLDGEWHPSTDCDDGMRQQQQYFLASGELSSLVFESAAVYHDENGFSSVQITLRSSKRIVTIRVKKAGDDLVAERIVDRAP